ncbi:MAG: HDOD domain-containing protein [Nitrospira sp.]|nr:MAG: HDOD domain-containing protein [Nitrospira sp.]
MAPDTHSSSATTDKIEQALIQKLDKSEVELPLLPQVASQVMALAGDATADAAKLSALIHQDQALAAHVLRIANSPAYMPRSPVVSLQHAVAMLGINLLSEIAFTASLKTGAFQVPGHEDHIKLLWRHSLASGSFSKEVARMRRVNVETAYLCGLLHGIGKPVVLRTVANLAKELKSPVDKAMMEQLLEGYHTRVGSLIAEKWGLPKQVAEAIAYYADYDHATSFRQECLLTCVADRMATHLLAPDQLSEEELREHPVFADLNLYPNDIDQLLAGKDKALSMVNAMNL